MNPDQHHHNQLPTAAACSQQLVQQLLLLGGQAPLRQPPGLATCLQGLGCCCRCCRRCCCGCSCQASATACHLPCLQQPLQAALLLPEGCSLLLDCRPPGTSAAQCLQQQGTPGCCWSGAAGAPQASGIHGWPMLGASALGQQPGASQTGQPAAAREHALMC